MGGGPIRVLLCVLACAGVTLGVSTPVSLSSGGRSRHAEASVADPLAGWQIFRSDSTPAAADVAAFTARHDLRDAELMERIAREPIASWFTTAAAWSVRAVRSLTIAASRHDAAALIVAYAIPGRGCTGGGPPSAQSDSEYLRWIGGIAAAIGTRRTIVILEPDAIPFAVAGCHIELPTIAGAVQELARAPGARVYLDAGNPSWITDLQSLAGALREADIDQAAGFSLNVANFQTNAASIAYGQSLSRQLGGSHFVIDTGRNGNGPDIDGGSGQVICNPTHRALGTLPTTDTGVADLDAYLWIKPPGSSDGSCGPGQPGAGEWWPQYALELAADAH